MSPASIKGQKGPGGNVGERPSQAIDRGGHIRWLRAVLSVGVSTAGDAEPATRAANVSISGNPLKLRELFGLLDEFTPDLAIVEPNKATVE
jgi:alkyl sulfatase BDS1-like metallo-beta-lactamase superfamily hydrolase